MLISGDNVVTIRHKIRNTRSLGFNFVISCMSSHRVIREALVSLPGSPADS
mgnify:FL=1